MEFCHHLPVSKALSSPLHPHHPERETSRRFPHFTGKETETHGALQGLVLEMELIAPKSHWGSGRRGTG